MIVGMTIFERIDEAKIIMTKVNTSHQYNEEVEEVLDVCNVINEVLDASVIEKDTKLEIIKSMVEGASNE